MTGGIRWWPAAVIVLLAAVSLVFIRSAEVAHEQSRTIAVIQVLLITLVLLLVWWLALSRVRWSTRLAGLGALVVAVFAFLALFRYQGLSGDLVPLWTWRWSSPSLTETANRVVRGSAPARDPSLAADQSGDYPQFLGPSRNGFVEDPGLDTDWKKRPPQLLWKRAGGRGWAAFSVSGRTAVTQEQQGEQEAVVAYDLGSGEVIWSCFDEVAYRSSLVGDGPRATPLIHQNRVYAVGATGLLNCLDLSSGRRLWQADLGAANSDNQGDEGLIYGYSASPLLVEGLLVVNSGRRGSTLLAYSPDSGELQWRAGTERPSYASPQPAGFGGVLQVVSFNADSLIGFDLSGTEVWRAPWPEARSFVCAQPLTFSGEFLLGSAGYGVGSRLYRIVHQPDGRFGAELVWANDRLKSKFANIVESDGSLFGLDDGILVCLDAADGRRQWKRGRYGHGQILLIGKHLLVSGERGEVSLVAATPEAHHELGRFQAIEGKAWNHPALAGDILLVRNDRQAAAYRLRCSDRPLGPNGRPRPRLRTSGVR